MAGFPSVGNDFCMSSALDEALGMFYLAIAWDTGVLYSTGCALESRNGGAGLADGAWCIWREHLSITAQRSASTGVVGLCFGV